MPVWLVWVPGKGAPKKLRSSLEDAMTEAKRLRQERTGREVYVFESVAVIPGRKLLSIRNGESMSAVDVEPVA